MASLSQTGCLLPQDTTPLLPLPNRPPFVLDPTNPTARRSTFNSAANCELTFSIPVEDWDLTDNIHFQWYVDYDPTTNPNPVYQGDLQSFALSDGGSPVGAIRNPIEGSIADFHLRSADPWLKANPSILNNTHTVEVLYTDGAVNEQRQPEPLGPPKPLPDGGSYIDTAYVVTYAWVIDVFPGNPCPPQ